MYDSNGRHFHLDMTFCQHQYVLPTCGNCERNLDRLKDLTISRPISISDWSRTNDTGQKVTECKAYSPLEEPSEKKQR